MPESQDPRSLVAVREPEKHWNDFEAGLWRRIDWKFVATTWAIAVVLAVVLSGVAIALLVAFVGNLDAQPGTRGAMIPVMTALGSFLAFVLVVSYRADRQLKSESFFTCLAIAGVHLVVLGALTLANLVIAGFDLPSLAAIFPGSGGTSDGLGFFTISHSMVGVLAGCFIAAGLMEADSDTHDVVRVVPGHEQHDSQAPE